MEQACYTFIRALDKWHNHLSGIKFIWETDHKAVTQLNKKAQNNKRCERWKLKILEYDFKDKYIPGLTDTMLDYLSRPTVGNAEEDPDQIPFLFSKSTQTDVSDDNRYSSIITTVEMCAMKLKNQTSNDSSKTKKLTLDSLNASTRQNRTILFSVEQLIQVHRNDSYAIIF